MRNDLSAREKPGQTLDATALVHEAYLRLVEQGEEPHWNNRAWLYDALSQGGPWKWKGLEKTVPVWRVPSRNGALSNRTPGDRVG